MYRNALSPLFLEQSNDVILDIWFGSSEMMGIVAFTAEMLSPLEAAATTPLTVSRIWDRWMDGTYRLAGNTAPDSFSWDAMPLKSGSVANTTTFAYSSGLFYQQEKPVKSTAVNLDSAQYHHAVLLGVSTSGVNDNMEAQVQKLAHWSPLVTGTGELTDLSTDMGGLEHLKTNYISPAIKNLQAAGKRVHIGAIYASVSGDSLSRHTNADAANWATHMGMIRRDLEAHLGFVGVPMVIMGVSQADYVAADMHDTVREQQQLFVNLNKSTTMFFDTRGYPTDDKVHFDGQSTFDIGWDVTASRFASRMGLARITKVF